MNKLKTLKVFRRKLTQMQKMHVDCEGDAEFKNIKHQSRDPF